VSEISNQEKHAFIFGENGNYRDTWRIFRIMSEFVEGYDLLSQLKKVVTVFGSARFKEDHPSYKEAQALGTLMGKHGFTTLTGGGPGIMQAANRGAFEAEGESVGINIELPFEQHLNPYLSKSVTMHYFFTRKVLFATPAQAFVFFPGGFGTLDEFWEIIDLMGDGYLPKAPIILVDSDYWRPLLDWLLNNPIHTITPKERTMLESCTMVETQEEAFDLIKTTKPFEGVCELSADRFRCEGEINWRIFRIMAELVEGFDFLTGLVKDISVFGTSRMSSVSTYYKAAEELGRLAGKAGFSIVTGGYKGIAEAANRGAAESGAESIGLYMKGAAMQGKVNKEVSKSMEFDFPFTRKFVLTAPSKGFVMFPGGLGTIHQTMEVLTLIQTGKMSKVPVVLFGSEYWQPLSDFLENTLAKNFKTINEKDIKLFRIIDDPQEALAIIANAYNQV
jgi:hypothetical protein